MKKACLLLLLLSAPCFAAKNVPTSCAASAATVQAGALVTLTDTIPALPAWAPAGYRANFEWLGPLRLKVKYSGAKDNSRSVVTVDTTGFTTGTYKAVGRLELLSSGDVIGYGKCTASFTVR